MKIYVYGIIDSNKQVDEPVYGLEKARVYNIPFRDIGVVASDLTGPMPDVTEDNILAHEDVVESLTENFTVLPVKFLGVFDAKENILSTMGDYYTDFKDNLNRLHNKVEFGIKVIWPAEKIKERIALVLARRQAVARSSCRKGDRKIAISDDSPAKKFIREKFEKYKLDKEFAEKANRLVNTIDIFLGKFAAEKKLEKLKTENLLLDGVYLVEKDKQSNFKEAFEHIRSACTDLRYLFSGPWPPYNFVILPRKYRQLRDSGRADVSDKVSQHRGLVGADAI
jgi:hypothetical protein